MADTYESVLCVKNEVFVYRIPPRPSNRGYRASEWKLDAPDWTGRLRVVCVNKDLLIKLEDKTSGDLFAQCPVDSYPGVAVESVMDSSRYFVIRIKDPSGRSAFIGIGFADRSDSFDLNVALQDHFKWLKQEKEAEKVTQSLDQTPKLNLGFKEGQTIKLNLGNIKGETVKSKPKRGMGGLLPPPPGGNAIKIPLPTGIQGVSQPSTGISQGTASLLPLDTPNLTSGSTNGGKGNVDLLFDLDPSEISSAPLPPSIPAQGQAQNTTDFWGDFTSANSASTASNNGGDWVQF